MSSSEGGNSSGPAVRDGDAGVLPGARVPGGEEYGEGTNADDPLWVVGMRLRAAPMRADAASSIAAWDEYAAMRSRVMPLRVLRRLLNCAAVAASAPSPPDRSPAAPGGDALRLADARIAATAGEGTPRGDTPPSGMADLVAPGAKGPSTRMAGTLPGTSINASTIEGRREPGPPSKAPTAATAAAAPAADDGSARGNMPCLMLRARSARVRLMPRPAPFASSTSPDSVVRLSMTRPSRVAVSSFSRTARSGCCCRLRLGGTSMVTLRGGDCARMGDAARRAGGGLAARRAAPKTAPAGDPATGEEGGDSKLAPDGLDRCGLPALVDMGRSLMAPNGASSSSSRGTSARDARGRSTELLRATARKSSPLAFGWSGGLRIDWRTSRLALDLRRTAPNEGSSLGAGDGAGGGGEGGLSPFAALARATSCALSTGGTRSVRLPLARATRSVYLSMTGSRPPLVRTLSSSAHTSGGIEGASLSEIAALAAALGAPGV